MRRVVPAVEELTMNPQMHVRAAMAILADCDLSMLTPPRRSSNEVKAIAP